MNTGTSVHQANGNADITRGILKRLVQVGVTILVQAAILFIASGRLDWVMAWVYIGVNVGSIAINTLVLLRIDPELIAERAQLREDAKGWDRPLAGILSVLGLATLSVAGLDTRFGWSPQLALAIQLVALVFVVLGYGLCGWAMASNKFFSGLVRIQKERGHTVATSGPYRIVRHPGYAGMMTFTLAIPLLLGSLWALFPAGLTVVAFVVRTALEDRTLKDELDGYEDYAGRVRYRLLPGVW